MNRRPYKTIQYVDIVKYVPKQSISILCNLESKVVFLAHSTIQVQFCRRSDTIFIIIKAAVFPYHSKIPFSYMQNNRRSFCKSPYKIKVPIRKFLNGLLNLYVAIFWILVNCYCYQIMPSLS